MPRLRNRALAALVLAPMLALVLALAGCDDAPDRADQGPAPARAPAHDRASLGLMTSLPLYWPLGADVTTLASGNAPVPWQRRALEAGYALVPLDTLSPQAALAAGAPGNDPLAGLARLAVIQPRGLSPADNVALDDWVRAGGRLLMVLDPALTGDYDLPLGDPRRPVEGALIPPVVARWGLAIRFDSEQGAKPVGAVLAGRSLALVLAGAVTITDPTAADCALAAGGAAARCRVGQGQVMLIADAAMFEHQELAGDDGAGLLALVSAALEQGLGENAGAQGLGVARSAGKGGKSGHIAGILGGLRMNQAPVNPLARIVKML
jgi:hypothetical protein